MSPFMAANAFQPPLFPNQEAEIAVPSVQEHLRQIRQVWREAGAVLTGTVAKNQCMAAKQTPDTRLRAMFGYHYGTYLCKWSPENWCQSLVHLK